MMKLAPLALAFFACVMFSTSEAHAQEPLRAGPHGVMLDDPTAECLMQAVAAGESFGPEPATRSAPAVVRLSATALLRHLIAAAEREHAGDADYCDRIRAIIRREKAQLNASLDNIERGGRTRRE